MKILANVYLLPTKGKSKICYLTEKGREFNDLRLSDIEMPVILDSENFQLYITLPKSDLDLSNIKEQEWFYDTTYLTREFGINNRVYLNDVNKQYYLSNYCQKVIASTDELLVSVNKMTFAEKLPSIPQEFVELYISEYNKENVIKQVEVELIDEKLKVNEKNEIIII